MVPISLQCPSQNCTLGDHGARYKTPELESGLAVQMLLMHNDNHKQPARVGETNSQNRKAEKVSRPTIKMGSSEDDYIFFQCLFDSYKRSCQLTNVTDIRTACRDQENCGDIEEQLG